MKIFKVPVSHEVYGVINVEAENKEDLLQKLKDESFVNKMGFPEKSSYVSGSYEIDFEDINSLNP